MSKSNFNGTSFEVQLELFDGPIDLLLHLVKQNELEIEKIALAHVASQYLECVQTMRGMDLEIAGEYLVIAATLLSIKSSVLLNKPVELVTDEDGNLIDPHEELLRKLREAAVYQDGAKVLGGRHLLGIDVFTSLPDFSDDEEPEVVFRPHDAMLLGKAFHKLLTQAGASEALMTIAVDSVSIVERMVNVLDRLKTAGTAIEFSQLIPEINNKASVVSTFLALLELCKRQAIEVRQDIIFEEIYIVLASEEIDPTKFSSEYDAVQALGLEKGALANG